MGLFDVRKIELFIAENRFLIKSAVFKNIASPISEIFSRNSFTHLKSSLLNRTAVNIIIETQLWLNLPQWDFCVV